MSDVIGAAEFELRATRKRLKNDLKDAERDLDQTLGRMERAGGSRGQRLGAGLAAAGSSAAPYPAAWPIGWAKLAPKP